MYLARGATPPWIQNLWLGTFGWVSYLLLLGVLFIGFIYCLFIVIYSVGNLWLGVLFIR
jgi:hypothetical protein